MMDLSNDSRELLIGLDSTNMDKCLSRLHLLTRCFPTLKVMTFYFLNIPDLSCTLFSPSLTSSFLSILLFPSSGKLSYKMKGLQEDCKFPAISFKVCEMHDDCLSLRQSLSSKASFSLPFEGWSSLLRPRLLTFLRRLCSPQPKHLRPRVPAPRIHATLLAGSLHDAFDPILLPSS